MRSRCRPEHRAITRIIQGATLVAVVALLVFVPSTAQAVPQPPTPTPTPSQATSPIQPANTPAAPPAPQDNKPRGDQLIDSMLGKQARLPGMQPLSHYDVGYSTGGWLGSFNPSAIMGWLTDIVFTVCRWMTAFASWAISYALTFGVADFLTEPAAKAASGFQQTVERLGLGWVFLVLAVAYAGWHALRGRAVHGVGEAAVSFLIATVLAGTLAAPASVLLGRDGMLGRTSDLSLALSDIALDPGHANHHGQPISAPLQAKLQHTLIAVPHQVLNWGQVLEGSKADPRCVAKYKDLLARGPWAQSDTPRDEMTAAGCGKLADFNKNGSANRLIVALMVQLAVLLACCLLVVMAFTVIGAQILLALLACFAPLALAAGILPGTGRQILIRWTTAGLRTLAGVVMSVLALSVIIMLAAAVLSSDADMPLIVRLGLLDVFLVVAFLLRKRLLEAGRRAATNLGHRLEQARIAGNHGRGLMPAGSAMAAAEAWGTGHQHSLGRRARSELRQVTRSHWADRNLARTIHRTANKGPDQRASQPLRQRLARTRTARTAKLAAKTTGLVLAATVGAPVYLPRASRTAKAASTAKSAALRRRLNQAKDTARNFGHEYSRNITAPARLAARIAVRNGRAQTNPTQEASPSSSPAPARSRSKIVQQAPPQPRSPRRTRTRSTPRPAAQPTSGRTTKTPPAAITLSPSGAHQTPEPSPANKPPKTGQRRRPRQGKPKMPTVKQTSRRPLPPADGDPRQDG
ncbi:hypothetical protein J4573_16570 [Actinomadura barringtoniae]|uniref:TrbL/VirB6 plasmid conjugal transfer protein n=1 Tax=Actinomadura barringtoniae TaxID=1427535 RepID=A0A939T3X0_9ACTN|nr:hypothetical protein [Actinomadura barringtoniae]MBO2448718.1 hypothetical protein [Actinomadura barringtoniae]